MATGRLNGSSKFALCSSAEKPYQPGDPIPCPDAIEDDSESTWSMWDQATLPDSREDAETQPMGLY